MVVNIVIRLYLVRHGETLANCAGLVVGQSDSPLTSQGKEQAQRLYQYPYPWCHESNNEEHNSEKRLVPVIESDRDNNTTQEIPPHPEHTAPPIMNWWRIHVSDLPRAQHTACLLLGLLTPADDDDHDDKVAGDRNNHDNKEVMVITSHSDEQYCKTHNRMEQVLRRYKHGNGGTTVTLDARIRETAKGVREGLPKNTSYDQALEIWKERHYHPNDATTVPVVPRHESLEEGWNRVLHWIVELVGDAIQEQRFCDKHSKEDITVVRPVLAVMHASILRNTLTRLILPSDAMDEGDLLPKPLEIPNTSVTMIDLKVLNPNDVIWEKATRLLSSTSSSCNEEENSLLPSLSLDPNELWTAQLVKFAWTGHLKGSSCQGGEVENAE